MNIFIILEFIGIHFQEIRLKLRKDRLVAEWGEETK
jgi:predicted GNAT superfamily acetyltransferase